MSKLITVTLPEEQWEATIKAIEVVCQQADRIAELEKGGEVAGRFYWESVVDGHVMAVPSEGTPHYNKDDFPLYTTPQTKPLSDEEIIKIFNKIWVAGGNTNGVMHRFARAIEAKVRGEK